MKDFLLSRGWFFIGSCSCIPKMDKYHSNEWPGWEIRINSIGYQIRFNGNQKYASAHESFESLYAKLFPNEHTN